MKAFLYLLTVTVAVCIITLWYQIYIVGNYYNNAGLFFIILVGVIPALVAFLSFKIIKFIKQS